jgi:hypothetical protein
MGDERSEVKMPEIGNQNVEGRLVHGIKEVRM